MKRKGSSCIFLLLLKEWCSLWARIWNMAIKVSPQFPQDWALKDCNYAVTTHICSLPMYKINWRCKCELSNNLCRRNHNNKSLIRIDCTTCNQILFILSLCYIFDKSLHSNSLLGEWFSISSLHWAKSATWLDSEFQFHQHTVELNIIWHNTVYNWATKWLIY